MATTLTQAEWIARWAPETHDIIDAERAYDRAAARFNARADARADRDARAAKVRAEITALLTTRPRDFLRRVETLEHEADRLTSADAINDRRAAMGLSAWANARD